MPDLISHCAREIMETTPDILQTIRVEMRQGHGAKVSIPQFRALRFIQANPDSSLTGLAEFLGLTLPSVSKLIDLLVRQDLVVRQESSSDRRKLTLELSEAGEAIVNRARASTQANMVRRLQGLSVKELECVEHAMQLLKPLFRRQEPSAETE
jgi:DNA-binding MarR family transcriptional regulator